MKAGNIKIRYVPCVKVDVWCTVTTYCCQVVSDIGILQCSLKKQKSSVSYLDETSFQKQTWSTCHVRFRERRKKSKNQTFKIFSFSPFVDCVKDWLLRILSRSVKLIPNLDQIYRIPKKKKVRKISNHTCNLCQCRNINL